MQLQFLDSMIRHTDSAHLLDALLYTAYDELMVIDVAEDTFEGRYHTDGKFFSPVINRSYTRLHQYVEAHMIHPEDREAYDALMDPETLSEWVPEGGIREGTARFLALDGNWHTMEQLLVAGEAYGIPKGRLHLYLYDIQAIREREGVSDHRHTLAAESLLDHVPGLLSEEQFFSFAQEKIPSLEYGWCLIAVDIKHFKLFKDLNGRQKGEALLIRFGEILRNAADATGGAAGYRGQDDYALLFPFDQSRIDALFSSLRQAIDSLSSTSGFFPIFGICMVEHPEDTALDLFNHAALTAEEIKDDLQYHIRVYDPELHERHVEEFKLISDFNEAMGSGAITFMLQPQCHVATRRIIGSESLARWKRPDGSFVPPAIFVPVLEKYGVVSTLDTFIWESVCRWLRSLLDRGIEPLPVSINVSRIDIFSRNVPEFLSGLMVRFDLPVRLLKVEITESAYVDDSERVRETINEFRARGFQVLMDDFGSGYSSLNMLRSISLDAIKLDAQFLRFSVGEEQKGLNILDSIINMTKAMGTPMIVEGVESEELVRYLTDMGCRYMQGYYFYRPMAPEKFEELLKDPARVDRQGIVVQLNKQMHVREFLDSNLYSDAMLNNVLGPVAFYSLSGDNVDITRFNQQFVSLIGLDTGTLQERLSHIQEFIFPDDRERFFAMLYAAKKDRINGCSGLFRVYKPNGTVFWIQVHVYYLREDGYASLFYASCRDMTEVQYMNVDLPGAYYRCTTDPDFEFLYISPRFLTLTGYTEAEIESRFGGRLARMIHPDDLEALRAQAAASRAGNYYAFKPYRILCADGSYKTVIDESRVTDRYGETCWQSIMIDITDIVKESPADNP